MKVVVDPAWELLDAADAAHRGYAGGGRASAGYRNSVLMVWANVVGRQRAKADFESALKYAGDRAVLAADLGVSVSSLAKLERRIRIVPQHDVVYGGTGATALDDRLTYGKKLGEGGTGCVWAATDNLDRTVAVKFISEPSEDAEQIAVRHAQALAKGGGHPNMVTIHYCHALPHPDHPGERRVGIVMEYVEGVTLTERLHRAINHGAADTIGRGLAGAVSSLHERGIIHGDLHSGNVLVDSSDNPKLIDIYNEKSIKASVTPLPEGTVRAEVADLCALLDEVLASVSPAAAAAPRLQDEQERFSDALDVRTAFLGRLSPGGSQTAGVAAHEFLFSWKRLEKLLSDIAPAEHPRGRRPLSVVVGRLLTEKRITKDAVKAFYRVRDVRNQYVHGQLDSPTAADLAALKQLVDDVARMER